MFCIARRSSRRSGRRIGGGGIGGGGSGGGGGPVSDTVWIVLGTIGGVLLIAGFAYCLHKYAEDEEEEEAEQTPARY